MMQEKQGLRIFDGDGQAVDLQELLAAVTREKKRVLVNDALGLLVDVSDLRYFTNTLDADSGRLRRAKINRIAKAKAPIHYFAVNMPGQDTVTEEDITLFIQEPRGTTKLVLTEGSAKQIDKDGTGRLRITLLTREQLAIVNDVDDLVFEL